MFHDEEFNGTANAHWIVAMWRQTWTFSTKKNGNLISVQTNLTDFIQCVLWATKSRSTSSIQKKRKKKNRKLCCGRRCEKCTQLVCVCVRVSIWSLMISFSPPTAHIVKIMMRNKDKETILVTGTFSGWKWSKWMSIVFDTLHISAHVWWTMDLSPLCAQLLSQFVLNCMLDV